MRVLVNTHHHGDHTHGNYLLPSAAIVAHEKCREEVITSGSVDEVAVALGRVGRARDVAALRDVRRSSVGVGRRPRGRVRYIGPAHTTNDVVAWVPERRVLFTGDLVFNGGTPFVVMGSVSGSLASVEALRAFGAETIVPGHGPVCGPEVFDQLTRYFEFVQRLASDAHAAGVAPLDAALQADLGEFSEWHDKERLVGNLHRAYAEIDGAEPGATIDVLTAILEMITYNGGEPLRCLA